MGPLPSANGRTAGLTMPPFKMKPPRYELRIREDGRAEAVVDGYVRFAASTWSPDCTPIGGQTSAPIDRRRASGTGSLNGLPGSSTSRQPGHRRRICRHGS